MAHHYKRCLGAAGLAALVVAGQDLVRTRRRQAVDPTSEWSRYARHPILRGLALFTIAAQVTVLALLGRQRRLFPAMQARAGGCLADGLLKVGPLYIKLGQIVSSKSGLLPKAWTPALEQLQDQVPAQSGEKAAALAYAAWPGGRASFDATFESVDWTPLAAASLGQVHRATLRNNHRGPAPLSASTITTAATTGSSTRSSTEQAHKAPQEVVALKLQRPFLREIYDQDFAFLMYIAQTVDRFLEKSAGSIGGVQQSWEHIFRNAEKILYREIDYVAEADNMIRFNRDFGLGKGGSSSSRPDRPCTALARNGKPLASASSWLRSPHVYAELSSEKVLVMEYVPSIKVTKSDELDRAGLTVRDKEYLAECLGRSYLRQLCCHKFCKQYIHAPNSVSLHLSHSTRLLFLAQFPRIHMLVIWALRRWTWPASYPKSAFVCAFMILAKWQS
jgi:predicted unusual protein kinase regulating ubiquinone biosynthesis (AarF/ABC1/UbiB family)